MENQLIHSSTSSINNKRIAKNTLVLYVRLLITFLISIYTSRVILEALGIIDYGIYNVVGGVISMLGFMKSSMANGIQRFINITIGENHRNTKLVFNTSIYVQIAVITFIVIFVEIVGLWLINNKLVIPPDRMVAANCVLQFSLISFVIVMLETPYNAMIIAHEKISLYAYISIVEVFLKLGIVFILPFFCLDRLVMYAFFITCVHLIILIVYMLICRFKYEESKFQFSFDKKIFRDILSFLGWNMFGALAHMMKSQGINVLLNMFFNPAINAARALAYQIMTALTNFTSNILIAARPQMIKSYAKNEINSLIVLLYRISKYSFYLLLLLSFPVLLEINQILTMWLGNNVPEYTELFSILVIITAIIEVLASPISTIVHATGKMKNYQIICSTIIMLIVPISYIILKLGGNPETPMIISIIVCIIVHGVRLILLRNILEQFSPKEYINKVILPILKVLFFGMIIPLILFLNLSDGFIRFFLILFISTISFAISIYIVGMQKEERIAIKKFIRKKI